MPNDKDYTMHDLEQDMHYIKGKVARLVRTVHGPDDSHEPIGLVHEVGQNSKFRSNVTKVLWMIGSAVIGIITYLITAGIG